MRDDEQKPRTRFSSWASRHNTSEAHRFGSRINAAFVHGKFTFLSGEVCASCDSEFMSNCRNRFIRFTKYPAHLSAVGRCESPCGETQNRQQLMGISVALCMATCRVSTQKSAEGIVLPMLRKEGLNVEMRMALS